MNEPTFKPQEWIMYELSDGSRGYGQITGAVTNNGVWNYIITGPNVNGEGVQVAEDTVTFTLENGNWTAPTHFGGSNSAYAQPADV